MNNSELKELLSRPTASVQDAGRALSLSRSATYLAAKRGDIQLIKIGGKLLVPTAWLRRVLQLGPED